MNYILGIAGLFVGCWVILTFALWDAHSTDKKVIASYVTEIATLKADAVARAARDKSAAATANSAVKESEKEGDQILTEKIPSGCEDVRTWAIKQSQGM